MGDKYNHKSVAEQRSVDMGFNLLMEPEYQNLRDFIYTNEKELIQFRHVRRHKIKVHCDDEPPFF